MKLLLDRFAIFSLQLNRAHTDRNNQELRVLFHIKMVATNAINTEGRWRD